MSRYLFPIAACLIIVAVIAAKGPSHAAPPGPPTPGADPALAQRAAKSPPQRSVLDELELVKTLRTLKPLPKVHYSWTIPDARVNDPNDVLLREYVRITHAVTLSGPRVTKRQVEAAVLICGGINATSPEIPATIGLIYMPWHKTFKEEMPPTHTGAAQDQELDQLARILAQVKTWLEDANQRHRRDVKLSAVLLDTERFSLKPGDSPAARSWNRAITEKHNLIYDLTRKMLPDVHIDWYNRGQIGHRAGGDGWRQFPYFTLEERGETFSCSLYTLPEFYRMREVFRRTLASAQQHGVKEVTPWIALGAGYQRRFGDKFEWVFDWDFDPVYSWQMGAELNRSWFSDSKQVKRFAPWDAARIAVFYPSPFDPRTPAGMKHFIAYVRGAHLIEKLPE
jgi:hypothetical protein